MSWLRSRGGFMLPAFATLVLVVAACEADDNDVIDDPLDEMTPVSETPTPAPVDVDDEDDVQPVGTPEPAEPEPAHEVRVNVDDIEGSGVSGELHLVAFNDQSEVTVELSGLDPAESYTAQIRSGSCGDEDAGLAFPLGAVEVNVDASTTVRADLAVGFGLLRHNHFTVELEPADEDATPILVACADLDQDEPTGNEDESVEDENGAD